MLPEKTIPLLKSTTEIIGGIALYSEQSGHWYVDVGRMIVGAAYAGTGFVRGMITLGDTQPDR